MKEIGIALLGLGNVGLGTYRILADHARDIERRLGARVRVRHILVRDAGRARSEDVPSALITQDIAPILAAAHAPGREHSAGGSLPGCPVSGRTAER